MPGRLLPESFLFPLRHAAYSRSERAEGPLSLPGGLPEVTIQQTAEVESPFRVLHPSTNSLSPIHPLLILLLSILPTAVLILLPAAARDRDHSDIPSSHSVSSEPSGRNHPYWVPVTLATCSLPPSAPLLRGRAAGWYPP